MSGLDLRLFFTITDWYSTLVNHGSSGTLTLPGRLSVMALVIAVPFGLGAFVLFPDLVRFGLAASLALGIITLPVHIARAKEALATRPVLFQEAWIGSGSWRQTRSLTGSPRKRNSSAFNYVFKIP